MTLLAVVLLISAFNAVDGRGAGACCSLCGNYTNRDHTQKGFYEKPDGRCHYIVGVEREHELDFYHYLPSSIPDHECCYFCGARTPQDVRHMEFKWLELYTSSGEKQQRCFEIGTAHRAGRTDSPPPCPTNIIAETTTTTTSTTTTSTPTTHRVRHRPKCPICPSCPAVNTTALRSVCDSAAARSDVMLAASSNSLIEGAKCSVCHLLVKILEDAAETPAETLVDEARTLCNGLILFKAACKSLISNGWQTIMTLMQEHASPAAICMALSVCPKEDNQVLQSAAVLLSTSHAHDMARLHSAIGDGIGTTHRGILRGVTQASRTPLSSENVNIGILDTVDTGIMTLPRMSRTTILPDGQQPLPAADIMQINVNLQQLLYEFSNEEDALKWLARYGLIANTLHCPGPRPAAGGAAAAAAAGGGSSSDSGSDSDGGGGAAAAPPVAAGGAAAVAGGPAARVGCGGWASLIKAASRRQASQGQQAGQRARARAMAAQARGRGRGPRRGQVPNAGPIGQAVAGGGAAQAAAVAQGGGRWIDGYKWRCPRCRNDGAYALKSVRTGSFFHKSHLALPQIMHLIYIWANQPTLKLDNIAQETGVSKRVIIDWMNFIRDICQQWSQDNLPPQILGGPGRVVEIDESVLYHAKYHVGHQLHRAHQWAFGMVERDSTRVVIIPVPNRERATLLPLLQQYVAPGTTVISDGWAAYGGPNGVAQAFNHQWVNHHLHFRDPNDPQIHTNHVEAMWGALKGSIRHLRGTSEALYPTYLYQYMFRRHHNNDRLFQNMLFWIRHYHPPPN